MAQISEAYHIFKFLAHDNVRRKSLFKSRMKWADIGIVPINISPNRSVPWNSRLECYIIPKEEKGSNLGSMMHNNKIHAITRLRLVRRRWIVPILMKPTWLLQPYSNPNQGYRGDPWDYLPVYSMNIQVVASGVGSLNYDEEMFRPILNWIWDFFDSAWRGHVV